MHPILSSARKARSRSQLVICGALLVASMATVLPTTPARASLEAVDGADAIGIGITPISMTEGVFSTLNIMAVLAALAIVYITWQAWSTRPRITDAQEIPTTTPPDDLHPAYAGVIASGQVRDSQLEAVVLELIRRGAITVEPDARERDKVQIRIVNRDVAEIPPEIEMLEVLENRSSDGLVSYRSLRRVRNDWGKVRHRLRQDMAERGWINSSMLQTRLPYMVPGVVGLGFTVALIVAAIVSLSGWLVLGALVVGITATFALSFGNIAPHTTVAGEHAAIGWRGLRSGLARARDDTHGDLDLDILFPYIVAMGMAAHYDRYLRRASQSGYIPAWIGRRARVQEWPEGWHTYWIALHTALAPTDPVNTTAPTGSPWRRSLTGGR